MLERWRVLRAFLAGLGKRKDPYSGTQYESEERYFTSRKRALPSKYIILWTSILIMVLMVLFITQYVRLLYASGLLPFEDEHFMATDTTAQVPFPTPVTSIAGDTRMPTRGYPRSTPLVTPTTQPYLATFVIVCGTERDNAIGEMRGLLSSALLLSSVPLHLVFLTDSSGAPRVNSMFLELPKWRMVLRVRIVVIMPVVVDIFSDAIDVDPRARNPGFWSIAKMTVPWLLPDIRRAIVLDTDMVFTRDPALLWAEFSKGNDNSGWAFKMPLFSAREPWTRAHYNLANVHGICSCVVLVNLDRARSEIVWPDVLRKALESAIQRGEWEGTWYKPELGKWHLVHSDQGMYWLLLRYRPNLISDLHPRWNSDRCHKWNGAMNRTSKIDVGLLHRNCAGSDASKTSDEANDYFRFYHNFQWRWIVPDNESGHRVVVTVQTAFNLTTMF